MEITGQLLEFSLLNIFQFIEQFHQTGLLSLEPEPSDDSQLGKSCYLWFQAGGIVAIVEQLDNQHLLSMIDKRGWIAPELLNILSEPNGIEHPLGVELKTNGQLNAEQLQVLFHAQVIQPVCALFKLSRGHFSFNSQATLPKIEMTGLSLPVAEATLLGLRVLRDWKPFTAKLPTPSDILNKNVVAKPRFQLDAQERQVWELVNGKTSIEAIAKQLQQPLESIQQIAFRMKVVGLLGSVSTSLMSGETTEEIMTDSGVGANAAAVANPSLVKNLVNLLNTKIV
ncbi:DUF4388 domain-containing protein [Scytonema millei]|uniref:DUF4388 domain-containing protein n=1 Tax=Scytonema millei VB511283 TaxID=1245923 RepID=A0A9X5E8Y0_9CYAN|nr:DUF4388 domain-containing protein [Scytonema millei]NHC37481.1 DUF4388 domain-containing protein [Scytonema millei VB511283]